MFRLKEVPLNRLLMQERSSFVINNELGTFHLLLPVSHLGLVYRWLL
jgi:hypothetical protein